MSDLFIYFFLWGGQKTLKIVKHCNIVYVRSLLLNFLKYDLGSLKLMKFHNPRIVMGMREWTSSQMNILRLLCTYLRINAYKFNMVYKKYITYVES